MDSKSAPATDRRTLTPLSGRVLLRREEASEKTPGGIILPDKAQQKPMRATVVAISDGRYLPDGTFAPHMVKAGDTVVFTSYSGTDIQHNGETLTAMREEDLICVLR